MTNNGKPRLKEKKAWPTQAAMNQIYDLKMWGGGEADYFSGEGSHRPELVAPYLEKVKAFLTPFEEPLVVCDLGCGDFNVGKNFVPYVDHYIAVDIVESLIQRNIQKFTADNLEFQCLDIAKDDLPDGDCAILRQVLQHLSNAEIQKILPKLTKYQYVILTEHLPAGEFEPNKDIISGQGIRIKKQSGVDLLAPPFQLKVKSVREMLSVVLEKEQGIVVTLLYQLF